MSSKRAPYLLSAPPLSGFGSCHSRRPAALSGAVVRNRERSPWSARSRSFRMIPATSGGTMRCIVRRRPGSIVAPSPTRTRRVSPSSHSFDRPAAVRSFASSDMPCPPTNCPPSVARIPKLGCPTANNLHSPSKVGSGQVISGSSSDAGSGPRASRAAFIAALLPFPRFTASSRAFSQAVLSLT
jgi:hypothetical protein